MGVGALRAVFLDRDGVLNRAIIRGGKPYPPASLGELEILPDVPGALAALKECGFLLLVVTNQPDVARGSQQRAVVESMHEALRAALPIDDFFVCYHDDRDACVIVPTVNPRHVTPHTEAFQAVVWHLIVSHPVLKRAETKWESVR